MAKINDEYDIGAAFEAIENELISSMIRNFENHKQEELDEKKHWSMWQTEMLKSLEKYKHDNQKKYGKQFKDINKQIEVLIRLARSEGGMNQEKRILEEIKKGFPAKRISKGGTAEFFKVNDRKLDALIQATTSDMQKAEAAVLRMANDQYRKIIYNAQVYANTGADTYEKAVDMATKDFLSAGLNCIQYTNGARHTIADYADMAIRTASKRAYLQGEGEMRQQWGMHLVIMNKRGSPCPKCLPFVGKILIDDVWSGGSRKDGKYPLMSSAVAAGLYHPRCKDSHTTYFPGIADLQTQNQQKETEHQEELKNLKLTNAIKMAIASSAQDSDLVAGLVDRKKLILGEDGKVTGLDEQVKALKESKPFLFKQEQKQTERRGFFPLGNHKDEGSEKEGPLSMKEAIAARLNMGAEGNGK